MMFMSEVITALIGVSSALAMILVKDVFVAARNERRVCRRQFIEMRLERAYVPLAHLAFRYLNIDAVDKREEVATEIHTILRNQSHLLSIHTTSAFYTMLDDDSTGAALLQEHFYRELDQLKEGYYQAWYNHKATDHLPDLLTRNHHNDRYTEEHCMPPIPQWYDKEISNDSNTHPDRTHCPYWPSTHQFTTGT